MSKVHPGSRVSPSRPPLPPPAHPPAPPRQPRPWIVNVVLVGFVVLALVALAGLNIVLVLQTRRPPAAGSKPEAAAPAEPPAPIPAAVPAPIPAAVPAPIPAAVPAPVAPKPPVEAKPEPKSPEPPKADAGDLPPAPPTAPGPAREPSRLEAVGVLTGVHLYQTHMSIGLLADAAESDVYTTEEADKLLDGITGMMDTVEKELAALPDASLTPQDRQALLKVKDLTGVLHTQAAELRAYWNTGEKEHADNYHKARNQAWEGVKALFNIKED